MLWQSPHLLAPTPNEVRRSRSAGAASPDGSALPKSEHGCSRFVPHPATHETDGERPRRKLARTRRGRRVATGQAEHKKQTQQEQQVARKGWHGGRPKINKRPAPARQTGQRGPVSSSRNSTSPANARLCILRGTLHPASGTTPAAIGGGPPRPPPPPLPPRRVVCVRLLGHPGIATATFGCAAFVPRAHIHTNYLVPHR